MTDIDVPVETRQLRSSIIVLVIVVIISMLIAAANAYSQFTYARNLEISGVVVEIQRNTDNHQLPRFVILADGGSRIAVSQFTIALNPSTIKVGDRIVKKAGSEFCLVNGKKVRFSLY